MHVIKARNVHEALPEAIHVLLNNHIRRESRNGPVLMHPTPVTTQYLYPRERVLLWPLRDANPFLHLFESLWMLGGRNDLKYLTQFVKQFFHYSDNGRTLHGAYGFRWREAWSFDQLEFIATRLRANPDDRRQVLGIWSPTLDLLEQDGKRDLPCNLTAHFQITDAGRLDMTVFNRSNDIIWGCYGANAVHFSFLQEYMAAKIGVPVGHYWQVSCNWHAYVATLDPLRPLAQQARDVYSPFSNNPYDEMGEPFPLVQDPKTFDEDLLVFLDEGERCMGYREPFFRRVAVPLLAAHKALRQTENPDRFVDAANLASECRATDWRRAAVEWIERRALRFEQANNDGVKYENS